MPSAAGVPAAVPDAVPAVRALGAVLVVVVTARGEQRARPTEAPMPMMKLAAAEREADLGRAR